MSSYAAGGGAERASSSRSIEFRLGRVDLLSGGLGVEPGTAVHLGEGEHAARAAGPLGLHGVTGDPPGIRVSLPGPGMHQLSRLLPDAA